MFDLKVGSHARTHWLLVLAGMLVLCGNLRAQLLSLSFSVSNSPSPSAIDVPLTNIITVTNLNSPLTPNMDVFITNQWSGPVTLYSYQPPGDATAVITNAASIVFEIGQFPSATIEQMVVTLQPTDTGFVTNTVTVSAPYAAGTNFSTMTVVNEITNSITDADLAVALVGPRQAVITNDWMTYQVLVTNLGPDTATDVLLTNSLPAGVGLRGVSPRGQSYRVSGTNLIFSLGTLADGAFTNLALTVQPTNAGPADFIASVVSSTVSDTNTVNNVANTNIVVGGYLSGQLTATLVSTQRLNLLNGFMEQTVVLSNAGPSSVAAARVVVSGLTSQLSNAEGTNNGEPFVVYGSSLEPGASARLLLQFKTPDYRPVAASVQAFGVPAFNWSPALPLGTPVSGLRIFRLPSGNMLVEFPSLTNRTYTVVYSDNVNFTNPLAAQPSIVSPANFVFWIDYGPPGTVSPPTNSLSRFYRVFLNP